jgi:hypothetical protein
MVGTDHTQQEASMTEDDKGMVDKAKGAAGGAVGKAKDVTGGTVDKAKGVTGGLIDKTSRWWARRAVSP